MSGLLPYQKILDFVPVEESLDIALLEFVEFCRERLFDDGIKQQLLVPSNIVMHIRNTSFDEFAEIGSLLVAGSTGAFRMSDPVQRGYGFEDVELVERVARNDRLLDGDQQATVRHRHPV